MDIYGITNELGESLSRTELIEKLRDMGISDEAINSGDSNAIMQDAESKGISSANLQAELEPKIVGAGDSVQADYQASLKAKGIPDGVISQGKDAVQAYAAQYGVPLPQSPAGANLNLKS